MKKIHYLCLLICIAVMGCQEEELGPAVKDGSAPASISNINIENLPGGAKITYDVPADPNLSYIEAEYIASNGKLANVRASHYTNELVIEGLGSTEDKEVRLYSVGKNEKRSEPITTVIQPLTPPITGVYFSLNVIEDFGGISIDYVNEYRANIAIIVMTKDDMGDDVVADIHYTSREAGRFSIRGFSDDPREFTIQIRDKWENFSEKLSLTLTPLYEMELDKARFREVRLPTDAPHWNNAVLMSHLWSNSLEGGSAASNRGTAWYRTANGSGIPHHFTFELGVTAKLSRYVQHQRGVVTPSEHYLVYNAGNPRYWEVWGATHPDPSGSWEGWTKLLDCTSIKPSGLPLNNNSDEDMAYALAGEEFDFPLDAPPVRYIRIKILGTWGLTDYMHLGELTFFGEVVD